MDNRILIDDLAAELGVPSGELRRLARTLGVDPAADALDAELAGALKSALQGMVIAAHARQAPPEAEQPAARPDPQPLMFVNMAQHDVRVSTDYVAGFNNMLRVVAALLADTRQTVDDGVRSMPWGEMYFLRADRSTPKTGEIELEYGDTTEIGFSQRERGLIGDLWWSANWFTESWTRPFEKLLMTVGAIRDPEADYRNQLESDLYALEAQGVFEGLAEWEITTGLVGRNIFIRPRTRRPG